MTTVFEGIPKFDGLCGDHARVTDFEDRVLILARDTEFDEDVTVVMTPKQARALAQGIIDAADRAEAAAEPRRPMTAV